MNNILDAVVKLLDPSNDFNKILAFLGIYLLLLWAAFCFWVFVDARKRYDNPLVALMFFVLVLVLNFPVLIFYLIIRPENTEDNILYLQSDTGASEGVNVPIVNFVGDKGVEMTFTLRINKHVAQTSDMKVNVDFVSENPDYKVSEKKHEVKDATAVKITKPGLAHRLKKAVNNSKNRFALQASKFKGALKKKPAEVKEEAPKKEEAKTEVAPAVETKAVEEKKSEDVKSEVTASTESTTEVKAEEKKEEPTETKE